MKNANPLFLVGTLGMLMTSVFNIVLNALVAKESIFFSFSLLYPVFIVFLLLGASGMVKRPISSKL